MVARVAGVGGVPVVCPNASAAPSTSRDAVVMLWFNRSLFIPGGMHARSTRYTAAPWLNVLNGELAQRFTAKNGTLILLRNGHGSTPAARLAGGYAVEQGDGRQIPSVMMREFPKGMSLAVL